MPTMRNRSSLAAALICVLASVVLCASCAANDWDERLEGTLPLQLPYTLEVPDPGSGVASAFCDTGEVALRLSDYDTVVKQGRINRGNWTNVSGVTLHCRLRSLWGSGTMALQINDGIASGRFQLRLDSGKLSILQSTPDPGQPNYVDALAGTWVELWVKVSGYRYWLYVFSGGVWNLHSVGSTPTGSGGAVYLGSASTSGTGAMDLDFWRLESTGGYAPGDPNAPCAAPDTGLAVDAAADPIVSGQSTSITVANSEIGVRYQLRRSPGNTNVGSPVVGTNGTISLPTGPLAATTTFNVLATSTSGSGCSAQLAQTRTVTVATPVSTIAQAKSYPDGTVVQLADKTVSAGTPACYWIEETDRSSGIKVNSNTLMPAGRRVTVIGTLATVAGERRINMLSETQGISGDFLRPVGMGLLSLGGRALTGYTPGVESGFGPNNIGTLVRVWGRVTTLGTDYYYIDDGSGLLDGTTTGGNPNVGVKVLATPDGLGLGDMVQLTAVNTCFMNESLQVQRAVLPVVADCAIPEAGLSVGAGADVLCSGDSTDITVAGSEIGVNYQLRALPGNVNVGDPVAGTGETISLPTGPLTATTTFSVLAVRAIGGCAVTLVQTKTIAVNPLPNAGLAVGALVNPINPGESSIVTVAGTQDNVLYLLRNDADDSTVAEGMGVAGTTLHLSTGPLTATTAFNVLAIDLVTYCSAELTQMRTITVGSRSKVGLHIVCCQSDFPNYLPFLQACSNAGHPVAVVKVVDDFSSASLAKQVNPATLTVGRINAINGHDLQGLDYLVNAGYTPQQGAQWYYNQVKAKWVQYRSVIDVWETCNEWSWHWAWQADFYIELMNLAEADGFRLGLWACSVGNPPTEYYEDISRACVRAKAHGNHILCLHEYGLWAPPGEQHALLKNAGPSLVTRYRQLYQYLIPRNADCPLVISECGENGGGGFTGTEVFVDDFAWYDAQMKQDSYVIGCSAWTLGNWSGANFNEALPALADYISTH